VRTVRDPDVVDGRQLRRNTRHAKLERIMDRRRLLSASLWACAAPSRFDLAWAQTAAGVGFGEGYAIGNGARLYYVRRLIILNAPHPAIFLHELRTNPAQIRASQYERAFHTAAPPFPRWYNYYRADPIKVPSSIDEVSAMEIPDLSARFFVGVARPPTTTLLRVRVPTLVIWGMGDTTILSGSLLGLEEYVRDLTVVRLNDAGRCPMRTHPGPANRAIRDIVRRSN
jgi:pimeloyl-ACP methyl ester carboxylesterase